MLHCYYCNGLELNSGWLSPFLAVWESKTQKQETEFVVAVCQLILIAGQHNLQQTNNATTHGKKRIKNSNNLTKREATFQGKKYY